MSVVVKLAKEIDEPNDISQPRKLVTRRDKLQPRRWSKRHRGACLNVEDEAFQEKDGFMDESRSEERVMASRSEMCESCEVASVEEGHDSERDEVHRALKGALETQVIVCSDEWLSVFSDHVGAGMRPTTKYAEGGAERQDSVTNGLRQIDCHLSSDVVVLETNKRPSTRRCIRLL